MTLDELLDQLADLVAERVVLRLARNGLPEPSTADEEDRLLDAREVAARLGVKPKWVYSHSSSFPFTRRLGPQVLRFSEQGLKRWIERRR